MSKTVFGNQVDDKTRCVHYASEVDVVAIKMKCCDKFYSCILCHNEMETHPAETWKKWEFEKKVVLCGNCRLELTVNTYQSVTKCPNCQHAFNEKCKNHYSLYFEAV